MAKAKRNKKVSTLLVVALLALVAIGGMLAYLQSEDSDVNVMTLGNVEIDQVEYERVVENGAWVSTGETDKYGYTPDKIQEFIGNNGEPGKPLYPAVFADGTIKWDDRNGSTAEDGTGHQQSWGQIGAPGSNQLFDDSVKNAQDKFVFVKNTGTSDAYVRTWFAFEQGSVAAEDFKKIIMTNTDKEHWYWGDWKYGVQIEGNTYVVVCATYMGPKSNPTGILKSGETSYASLLQVYMRPEATNEDVVAIDGNGNGTYDILVKSQAVQTAGFANNVTLCQEEEIPAPVLIAINALNTAFSEEIPWEADTSKPKAKVTPLNIEKVNAMMGINGTVKTLPVVCAYQFEPTKTLENIEEEYANYYADFEVSANQNIPGNSIALIGYYKEWCQHFNDNWVALTNEDTIEADTTIRLVETLGVKVTYEQICQFGNDEIGFQCGIAKMKEVVELPKGTTITVKLCLYNPEMDDGTAGKGLTVGKYTCTFN